MNKADSIKILLKDLERATDNINYHLYEMRAAILRKEELQAKIESMVQEGEPILKNVSDGCYYNKSMGD